MGSPKCHWRRAAAYVMASIGLAGCASNESSAPISSVNGGNNNGIITARPSMGVQRGRPPVENQVTTGPSGNIIYNRSYNTIPKGSYAGSTYVVKRGDTLFYIAWITGNDYRDLAKRNNIPEPYGLNVGQTLQVGNGTAPLTGYGNTVGGGGMLTENNTRANVVPNPPSNTKMLNTGIASQANNAYSEGSGKQNVGKMLPSNGTNNNSKLLPTSGAVVTTTAPVTAPGATSGLVASSGGSAAITNWRWPTDGKIIDNFSSAEGGNKGIDIAGSRGQPVRATADGRVVYAGNALRGYGNLIIIKHNDDYLSAYAHNDTMLVREQQEVRAGQQIATMGSTGTSSVRLHFEIRYKGKSVNPLRYLPQR
ncbi:murein hydrolase activator NlpD [Martelella alba]|nr:murein hydrolase activator NlpD [Martelella alba]